LPVPMKEILRRIEAKTAKTASCWLWQGGCAGGVTPVTTIRTEAGTKQIAVRRLLWEHNHGPIPPGFLASTSCMISHCVKPEHIAVMPIRQLRIRTNRRRRGQVPKGMTSNYKLGPEATQAMWDRWAEGKTLQEIAQEFGVGISSVGKRLKRAGKLPSKQPDGTWIDQNRIRRGTRKWIDKHRIARGERNSNARLTQSQVLAIAALRDSDLTINEIIAQVGVHVSVPRISYIMRGRHWGWLTGIPKGTPWRQEQSSPGPQGHRNTNTKLTVEQVLSIAKLGKSGQLDFGHCRRDRIVGEWQLDEGLIAVV
jgi:hypothetical protein